MTEVQIHVEVFLNGCWNENKTKEVTTLKKKHFYDDVL
jgi:hypothetical protein